MTNPALKHVNILQFECFCKKLLEVVTIFNVLPSPKIRILENSKDFKQSKESDYCKILKLIKTAMQNIAVIFKL